MSPSRPTGHPTTSRKTTLDIMRSMKRALDGLIRPLATSKSRALEAEGSADYWAEVWRSAQFLRLQADKLGAHAARQGRLTREEAHPANQTPTAWELSE